MSGSGSVFAADFHKLESRLRLSGWLVTCTGLRIGSGGAGELDAVDLPVLRDGGDYPLIPGSSLKGALRSTIEALVRAAAEREVGRPEKKLWACDPLDQNPGGACGYHASKERKSVDPEGHCAVCRLLGSHVLASHVRFSDALLDREQQGEHMPVEVRDGVAIDRDLGVVYGNQKYDFEVVAPGARFRLEVFVENPQDWLMGLLLMGFDQLAEGFTALGGFTSRGLGRVALEWTGLTEVTARALLAGGRPQELDAIERERQFTVWRKALAARYQAEKGEG